LNLLKNTTRNN